MLKRFTAVILSLAMTAFLASCAGGNQSGNGTTDLSGSAETTAAAAGTQEEYFADGDYKDVTGETPNAEITLSGGEGTISDTTRGSSGATVTITSKGIYRVTGESENVTILVNDETESGNIYLVLDGVTMTNDASPCILVEKADKVILQTVGETALTCTVADDSAAEDGAVYAKDDLTINGSGALTVNSSLHGVVCKDDLRLTGGKISITAENIGLKSGGSVRVGGGEITVSAGHDGVQATNNDGTGYFHIADGVLTVDAGYDGICADTGFSSQDGEISITAGGGSDNAKDSDISQKGIKCMELAVSGGAITVSSADDAIHCENAAVSGGSLTLSSSDDGIHANSALAISGGDVSVTKSYEGIEAQTIAVAGGNISVYAGDDGVNAAGGSDSASTEDTPWSAESSASGSFTVSGGTIYVNANGDGLDSNGSLIISGGTVIVEGPTDNGNGALDKGDGSGCVAQITGGTVLALGSAGMAVNFDSGSQCSALVAISVSAGDTVSVDDGSGFTFTATKSFSCAVYSSPSLRQGESYTLTAGSVCVYYSLDLEDKTGVINKSYAS